MVFLKYSLRKKILHARFYFFNYYAGILNSDHNAIYEYNNCVCLKTKLLQKVSIG